MDEGRLERRDSTKATQIVSVMFLVNLVFVKLPLNAKFGLAVSNNSQYDNRQPWRSGSKLSKQACRSVVSGRRCFLMLLPIALYVFLAPVQAAAAQPFPASEFHLKHKLLGYRVGDARVYELACKRCMWAGLTNGTEFEYVSSWLAHHPHARVVPVSITTETLGSSRVEWVFAWIEDGDQSVNVSMIREGVLPKSAMIEIAANDSVPARRLISGSDYAARVKALTAAELLARKAKVGIWADAMAAEREVEQSNDDALLYK
jgi:hypothetical protein